VEREARIGAGRAPDGGEGGSGVIQRRVGPRPDRRKRRLDSSPISIEGLAADHEHELRITRRGVLADPELAGGDAALA